jgi:cbb3-type cytochrome oxidase maturation protein
MSVIYIVLPLALLFVIVALIVFTRSVRSGQFDDMDTPGVRILHDDEGAQSEQDGKVDPKNADRRGRV